MIKDKKMEEPTLQGIDDYNTLQGTKRKVVWSVIIIGLFFGAIYIIASNIYDNHDDQIQTNDVITVVPSGKTLQVK